MNMGLDKKLMLRRELEKNIISGIFRSGEKLPSERKLCTKYNLSRPVVRTTIQSMIDDDLIVRSPGKHSSFISETALEELTNQTKSANMTLSIVIPIPWMNNPLIIKMFDTLKQNLNSDIQFKVYLGDWISLAIEQKQKSDVLVIFNDYEHASPISKEMQRNLKSDYKDVIVINEKIEGLNYIGPDHFEGGRLMAQHLLENNHKVISCISDSFSKNNDAAQRYHGFYEEFSKQGEVRDIFFPFSPLQQITALSDLIFYEKSRPSALVCFQDMHASFIYEAIRVQKNIRIPEDISVIGFDDQYISQYMSPALTTVKYPAEIIGKCLSDYINEIYIGKGLEIDESIIPILISRNSVAKL